MTVEIHRTAYNGKITLEKEEQSLKDEEGISYRDCAW